MSSWFDRLAERRMLKARAEGKLSGLPGEGKPLPQHPEAALVDPGEAVGFRIMAEHGALPEEIVLRKQLAEAKAAYAAATGAEDRRSAMARIAELDMKLSIATEARRRFLR
ncbi:DUF1992 domain-containing protein [Roseicyclus persicicus]|uniref:DUF1992 domain-containing protein n=1 Tax=Roseicyclus persicicus TaxID=2650661 RepID=A0A7X6GVK7_9RHOB|nr:DUF1992 domain-containing protein [Roseibacterium persicicum]NKX43190.1 DUF1992 domain-containing protein [Roseibacterium persicicum]